MLQSVSAKERNKTNDSMVPMVMDQLTNPVVLSKPDFSGGKKILGSRSREQSVW